jgi:hypothetical protein
MNEENFLSPCCNKPCKKGEKGTDTLFYFCSECGIGKNYKEVEQHNKLLDWVTNSSTKWGFPISPTSTFNEPIKAENLCCKCSELERKNAKLKAALKVLLGQD